MDSKRIAMLFLKSSHKQPATYGPAALLPTAICSPAKQNDRPHESCLAQGMAKILLFNFVLLPSF